ncbi:unnamed protein product [Linum trigynum]|uniref:Uncharacterized protein n=1 Tax=Linum trigynum TaxID=586398 RepID=A0AAV2FYD5_9ROSI
MKPEHVDEEAETEESLLLLRLRINSTLLPEKKFLVSGLPLKTSKVTRSLHAGTVFSTQASTEIGLLLRTYDYNHPVSAAKQ